MTRDDVLNALRTVGGLPKLRRGGPNHRTIYQGGEGPKLKPSNHFWIDYASFPGGTSEEVPLSLIEDLEREGLIIRAFPDQPHIQAWILKDWQP